jgi:hypothetical protein
MGSVSRTRSEAEHARPAVTPSVPTRNLTGPPPKTGRVDVQRAGVEGLGGHFHPGSARKSGTLIPRLWPGPQAMQAIRRHRREQTERRDVRGTIAAMVATRHRSSRGWRHECRVGHSTKTCQALDRSVRPRVGPWLRARLTRGPPPEPRQALERTSGLEDVSARGSGGTHPGTLLDDGGRKAGGGRTARTVCRGGGWTRRHGGMVNPPGHRKRRTGNPPPTAGAPGLDPTSRRPPASAPLPLPGAADAGALGKKGGAHCKPSGGLWCCRQP